MTKGKIIISIALIIILSILNYVAAEEIRIKNPEALIEAFNVAEAELLEINTNYNAKIFDRFLEIDELKNIAEDIKSKLDIKGQMINRNNISDMNEDHGQDFYILELTENEDQNILTIHGNSSDGNCITIILVTYRDVYSNIEETDLVVDIINSNFEKIKEKKDILENILKKFNTEAEITTCITGTFEGKLNKGKRYEIVSRVLDSINGKKVEGIIDSSLISISAYSPYIERFIYTGNKKMNLNIAMRYNEYEDKTYIWIGTPIITTGY